MIVMLIVRFDEVNARAHNLVFIYVYLLKIGNFTEITLNSLAVCLAAVFIYTAI